MARKIGRFVALDQDEQSLAKIREIHPFGQIVPIQGSVRQLLAEPKRFGSGFNLVYSLGLFDYLSQPVAEGLLQGLFSLLKSGVSLIIANFGPATLGAGYMEAFMDWWLIHRGPGELEAMTRAIPKNEISRCEVFSDQEE